MTDRSIGAYSAFGHSSTITDENGDQINHTTEPQAKHLCYDSSPTLETINDDCLREICKYLNIIEVHKLSKTCTRLQSFANDLIFPKIARKMVLTLTVGWSWVIEDSEGGEIELESTSYRESIECLGSLGRFVKHLTLIVDDNSRFMLSSFYDEHICLFPNLDLACIKAVEYTREFVSKFAHIIKYAGSSHKVKVSVPGHRIDEFMSPTIVPKGVLIREVELGPFFLPGSKAAPDMVSAQGDHMEKQ